MCGIFAIFSLEYKMEKMKELIENMERLQHRGKDGYGLVGLASGKRFIIFRKKGMITDKLNVEYGGVNSYSCLGHLRYSTSGATMKEGKVKEVEIQPIKGVDEEEGIFYIAHNGNIPNRKQHDTLYLKELIERGKGNFEKKLINLMETVPAAYSIVILTSRNKLYILRDKYGIRPMCIGEKEGRYYVSSESCAFDNGVNYIRDVNPGEIIKIDENGLQSLYNHVESKLSLCTFEILYFLNENSYVDGLHIKNIRKNLGRKLAGKEDVLSVGDDLIVMGIPLTGICYGKEYAQEMGYKYEQLIKKKENATRTFIILNEVERKKACEDKFIYEEEIKDKRLVVVDDTIVRGNVIKSIIRNLKKLGAREIHIRIPGPPVIDICELGISIQSKEELIMNERTIDEVCEEIGADTLRYLKIEDMEYFPKDSYNQCFTGYIEEGIIQKNLKKGTRRLNEISTG